MATVSENREITIPYKNHHIIVEEYKNFGWQLVSKLILNRFGGPLQPDEHPDEDEMNEKCHVRLSFYRCVKEENLKELMELQSKNDKLVYKEEDISGKAITGTVFMSLASFGSYGLGLSLIKTNPAYTALLIVNGLLIGAFITWIYIGLNRGRANAVKDNQKIREKKQEIFRKANKLL